MMSAIKITINMLVQGLWVFPCTLNIHFPTLACNQMSIHRIGDNVIAIVVDEGDATSVMKMIMEWSKHPMHQCHQLYLSPSWPDLIQFHHQHEAQMWSIIIPNPPISTN